MFLRLRQEWKNQCQLFSLPSFSPLREVKENGTLLSVTQNLNVVKARTKQQKLTVKEQKRKSFLGFVAHEFIWGVSGGRRPWCVPPLMAWWSDHGECPSSFANENSPGAGLPTTSLNFPHHLRTSCSFPQICFKHSSDGFDSQHVAKNWKPWPQKSHLLKTWCGLYLPTQL